MEETAQIAARAAVSAPAANAMDSYSPSVVVIASSSATYPLHRQHGYEFIYIEQGAGMCYADGRAFRLEAGDLLFVSHDVTHGFTLDRGSKSVLAGVGCDLMPQFTEFVDAIGLPFFLMPRALDDEQVKRAIGHIVTHPAALKSGIKLMSEFSMLLDALATRIALATHLPRRSPESATDRFADAVYIEVDRSTPSLDRIAGKLGLSRSYVSRHIKRTLGLPLPAYAAVARVDASRRLLVQTTKSISEIARLCHYSSIRTFDRQFIQIAGTTASAYRAEHAPSQIIDYDLPGHRAELETFYTQLIETSPSFPRR